ncbi:hypothetical protein P4123_30760 [Pseudomonas aeruginosa]|nr:hypothetical protein [Pseudomonas aeruginosa]
MPAAHGHHLLPPCAGPAGHRRRDRRDRCGSPAALRHYSLYFYDTILYVDWPDALREGR